MGSIATQTDFVLFPAASISGVVVDARGNPLPGRTIRVAYRDPEVSNLINRFGMFAAWMFGEEKTDLLGRFNLANVQPDAPITIEVCSGSVVGASYDIQLKASQSLQGVVLTCIDDPPWLLVRILGQGGQPVTGAHLQLSRDVPNEPQYSRSKDLSRARFTSTNESGEARFQAVHPGRQRLIVRHPEYETQSTNIYVAPVPSANQVLLVLLRRNGAPTR